MSRSRPGSATSRMPGGKARRRSRGGGGGGGGDDDEDEEDYDSDEEEDLSEELSEQPTRLLCYQIYR